MGGSQSQPSNIGMQKGSGYRILGVEPNSPADGKFDIYFDFIIDVISNKQPERNPRQILEKLTEQSNNTKRNKIRKFEEVIAQNQNTPIIIKTVSTKYRNVKNVQITPNRQWKQNGSLLGLDMRLERYDEAFDTYFPFSDIKVNSPVKRAGIKEGQYLIGVKQFKFQSVNSLLENFYDRFFDKEVQDKHVNFAVYNLKSDQLRIVPVLLARGWGDKGLLGCQFLDGHLHKFPRNLQQIRQKINNEKQKNENGMKIKKQLSELNGASVNLVETLKAHRNLKRKRNVKAIKSLLEVEPVRFPQLPQASVQSDQLNLQNKSSLSFNEQMSKQKNEDIENVVCQSQFKKLEMRVKSLQSTVAQVREIIQSLQEQSEEDEEMKQ